MDHFPPCLELYSSLCFWIATFVKWINGLSMSPISSLYLALQNLAKPLEYYLHVMQESIEIKKCPNNTNNLPDTLWVDEMMSLVHILANQISFPQLTGGYRYTYLQADVKHRLFQTCRGRMSLRLHAIPGYHIGFFHWHLSPSALRTPLFYLG